MAITAGAVLAATLALMQLASARTAVVDQLDPALLSAQSMTAGLLNQETAVRGYAITANPTFLEPDERGRQQQWRAEAALRALGEANPRPELTTALTGVRELAARWRTEYADPTIAEVRAGGLRGPGADPDAGKARFDEVRQALDAQRAGLAAARNQGRADLDAAARGLVVTAVAIAVGLVALLAGLVLWVRRTIIAPVSRLADEVRVVAGGEFSRRLTGHGPREIVELTEDVDSMRARIVTELRASQYLNTQLNQQTDELARSNRDLEQFAYVASHDLQEPLRKVSGFCELLRTRYGGQLDDRADQYIDFAVDGARRMSRLIAELLAFSRVGRGPATERELDCGALLDQALRNLDGAITETAAQVTHDPLPTVRGEQALLVTVFQNLVGNAVKFRGEQPPWVHVGARLEEGLWWFRVSDNGMGIDQAYAEKVFVIFQRLHPKEEYPGTGIGLALCRKIVEYHGGTIWLDPVPASGATFCFTLPSVPGPEPGPIPTTVRTTAVQTDDSDD